MTDAEALRAGFVWLQRKLPRWNTTTYERTLIRELTDYAITELDYVINELDPAGAVHQEYLAMIQTQYDVLQRRINGEACGDDLLEASRMMQIHCDNIEALTEPASQF
jgi:hypothetical protein